MKKILVIGSLGQIGTELVNTLRTKFGTENVIASDIKEAPFNQSPFEVIDAMNYDRIEEVVHTHGITDVYLLAALLSATAEKMPRLGWDLNMEGLFNVLNLAKEGKIKKIFWPSSIAVFGPTTPQINTPQDTIMDPTTVYGISKLAGERWCEYYFEKHGVDVRSIRYPGLISYKALPGGGTTDYAVDIFYYAKQNKSYTCFLKEDQALPMMMMDDAIRATIELMEAPAENVKDRSSYNISGSSFTPATITAEIQKHKSDFEVSYAPDFRQEIAETWPGSIDDSVANKDWGWKAEYDLAKIVKTMLENVDLSLLPAEV
jgi:nucleoside-diphosphate-sugar epimerase